MTDRSDSNGKRGGRSQGKREGKAVPTSRVSRFARVAKLASGVAGGMIAEGTRQLRSGNRLNRKDLLLTPANARRVTKQLSEMRGAAMKMGQMLSMDTGELLPKELADILASLRSDATSMPESQLEEAMTEAYGSSWEKQFKAFDWEPIAAASIGQVHRAVAKDGRDLALKIQYPGVKSSISSDVDNIATVLRVSGLVPGDVDLTPLLEDTKQQLMDEADYEREGAFLRRFGDVLEEDERFLLPELADDLTRQNVLAMSYVPGGPMEAVERRSQEERNRVMTTLLELMLTELFELRMVQTDPNFANYQYRWSSGQIVLLDFGATREYSARFVSSYKSLAKAATKGDRSAMAKAAARVGYSIGESGSPYQELLLDLLSMALEPLTAEDNYDFADSSLPQRLSEMAEDAKDHAEFWQAPPADVVYFHRKLGGMYMLASRLQAQIDSRQLMQQWV